jgi:hypothetical protein
MGEGVRRGLFQGLGRQQKLLSRVGTVVIVDGGEQSEKAAKLEAVGEIGAPVRRVIMIMI